MQNTPSIIIVILPIRWYDERKKYGQIIRTIF